MLTHFSMDKITSINYVTMQYCQYWRKILGCGGGVSNPDCQMGSGDKATCYQSRYIDIPGLPTTSQDISDLGLRECTHVTRGDIWGSLRTSKILSHQGLHPCYQSGHLRKEGMIRGHTRICLSMLRTHWHLMAVQDICASWVTFA